MADDERRIKMNKQFSFYKKKAFYIVLIVIFSVLLVFDIGIGLFVPSMNMGFGNGSFSQFPGGMDFGDMEFPEGGRPSGGSGSFPGGGGSFPGGDGSFPSGDGSFPGGGGSFPGGDGFFPGGSGSFPGGDSFFQGGSSQRGTRPASMGFLQTIKNNWILIAVILAVLDGFCIYMLRRIKKNNGTPNSSGKQNQILLIEDKEREYPEWIKKISVNWENLKEKFPILKHMGTAVLAVLLVSVLVVSTAGNAAEVAPKAKPSVYSDKVEKGDITKVVSGTGTLTDSVTESVELPSTIEITKWYVSNGDVVVEGQKLAQVDKVSVMSAIADIQDKLTSLDRTLSNKNEETISETIKANTNGKIKMIYAESGKSVVDTMYEHGALMLVSLDGMMEVSFETTEALCAGDLVSVVTEDGSSFSGKVQSNINGKAIITMSDDYVDYAEKVTVTTEDGVELGTAEAYIHSELKVTGYAGTISSVNVSVNADVTKGETLISLTDTEYKAEYETLLLQRRELEEMMQNLMQIYKKGSIYADRAGIVKDIGETISAIASTTNVISVSGQQGNSMQQSGTGMGNFSSGMGNQTETQDSSYAVTKTSFVSIVPKDKLTISVTVDEMDILSVAVGQETEITVDAFPGQSFTGSVSSVDYNGTNSGGSTKYTVQVMLDRGENMLDGMNAAVSIIVDRTEGVLLVPVESLVEDENGVYVYTQYDEKKELFKNPVEVTTGASDGTYVEILSGLEEGSEYWYSSLDKM